MSKVLVQNPRIRKSKIWPVLCVRIPSTPRLVLANQENVKAGFCWQENGQTAELPRLPLFLERREW